MLVARLEAAPATSSTVIPLPDESLAADDITAASPELYDSDDPTIGSPFAFGPRLPHVELDELEAVTKQAPPVSMVVAAAYRAAAIADDPATSWRVRTHLAGLVPSISVHDGRDATWSDSPDPSIGYISVVGVSATWNLGRLVFDPNELHISTIEVARRRDRRRVATVTIRKFFAWLQLRAAAIQDSRWSVRADEAAAELDALTDGWFTNAVRAGSHPP